jgi:hypothetical protein
MSRIRCCVPFCRRTASQLRYPDAEEIICGKHYRLANGTLRRRLTKVRRLTQRVRTDNGGKLRQAWHLDNALWGRIKKQAIERAVGISA